MQKPVLFFAIIVGVFVSILSLFVHQEGGNQLVDVQEQLLGLYAQDTIEFAGESVPVDDIVYRQSFDRELTFLAMNIPQLILYHKRTAMYFPHIEEQLAANDMPDDLKYVAVAESALRNDALSSAGAAGIWQFLSTTAQEYGLRVDQQIDQRGDFEKVTQAAIEYLSKGYEQFGSRTLSVASYNRGMGGIQRALDTQQVDDYYDLILPEETMRYVFRIVTIKYAMKIMDKHYDAGLYGPTYDTSLKQNDITTTGGIDNIYGWLSEENLSPRRFYDMNPWVTSTTLPAGSRSYHY